MGGGAMVWSALASLVAVILDLLIAGAPADRMSKIIQNRNVPAPLHRRLKVRAAGDLFP